MDGPPSLLSPSSDLAQLLSSLGVSTSSSPTPSSSTGPDPLLIARSRLAALKSSIEYGTEQLKSLASITPLSGSTGEGQVAIRTSPPITSKLPDAAGGRKEPPPFVLIGEGEGGEIELACEGVQRQGVSYTIYNSKHEAILATRQIVTGLIEHFETLRNHLVKEAKDRIEETMQAAQAAGVVHPPAGTDTSSASIAPLEAPGVQPATLVDEDGRVLNEEGLPFVDLNEILPDDQASGGSGPSTRSTVSTFEPQEKLTGEARKKWIESVFSRFGKEDDQDEDEDETDKEQGAKTTRPITSSSRSSEPQVSTPPLPSGSTAPSIPATPPLSRPPETPPLKSVLKPSSRPTTPRPSFGSSGIRKGFLNMNPSSPAAISSSDPLEAYEPAAEAASDDESGGGARGRAKTIKAEEERMSKSEELPPRSALGGVKEQKKKKSVRIQSPGPSAIREIPAVETRSEAQSASLGSSSSSSSLLPPAPMSSNVRSASSLRNEEEDTVSLEAEAARILSLLGPEVVQGTPAGDEALRKLRLEEEERTAQLQAEEVRRLREEKKREAEKGKEQRPAIGLQVKERERGTAGTITEAKKVPAAVQNAKVSAFKRGFLNAPYTAAKPSSSSSSSQKPAAASGAGPKDPKVSLGMSALDRSLIKDAPLSQEREAKGLPPAVPHARPSKAYAEKLEKKQMARGESSSAEGSERSEAAKVVDTGSEEGSKVRFKIAGTDDADNDADEGERRQVEQQTASARQRRAELEEAEAEEAHHSAALVEVDDDEDAGEIDEHDEEAYARAAYASGDHSDDEGDLNAAKLRQRFDLFQDEDDEDEQDSDWDLENEDDYGPDDDDEDNDPSSLVTDLESAELARSYALAKSQQMASRSQMTEERRRDLERAISGELSRGRDADEEEAGGDLWTEEEIDGRDLSSVLDPGEAAEREGAGPNTKMSRFRASRIVKALGMGDAAVGKVPTRPEAGLKPGADEADRRADEAGHDLAHLLEGATNIGPEGTAASAQASTSQSRRGANGSSQEADGDQPVPPMMILPSLTPLRFPRKSAGPQRPEPLTEDDPLPREGVDLEGETDEDEKDDMLMDIMRARLQEKRDREERKAAGESAGSGAGAGKPRVKGETVKRREEGDIGDSGKAMPAPPALKSGRSSTNANASADASQNVSSGTGTTTSSNGLTPPSNQKSALVGAPDQRQSNGREATIAPVAAADDNAEPKPKMSKFKAARLAAAQGGAGT